MPDEKIDSPRPVRTAPEDEISSENVFTTVWKTPEESAIAAPKPFLSTMAPLADMAIRRPWMEVSREKRFAIYWTAEPGALPISSTIMVPAMVIVAAEAPRRT